MEEDQSVCEETNQQQEEEVLTEKGATSVDTLFSLAKKCEDSVSQVRICRGCQVIETLALAFLSIIIII